MVTYRTVLYTILQCLGLQMIVTVTPARAAIFCGPSLLPLLSLCLEATEIQAARGKKEAKNGKKNLETRSALVLPGHVPLHT